MRKNSEKFRGTGVAVVTPFLISGAIDFNSLERLLDHTIDGGVNYIVLLGTTGESPTISKQEKKTLVEFTTEKIAGRAPLVVGVGGNCTSDVVLAIHGTPMKGVDGILSVSPYYNKPQQEGIFRHYKTIAEASPVPVILYTVPGRTGGNISAETTLRLADACENIVAIKEASANLDQIFQVIAEKPDGFLVISGDDALTLPLIAAGADGVISVTANALPEMVSGMVNAALKNDYAEARNLHYRLLEFTRSIFSDGSPAGIKSALKAMNLCENVLRLPLVEVQQHVEKTIHDLLYQILNK